MLKGLGQRRLMSCLCDLLSRLLIHKASFYTVWAGRKNRDAAARLPAAPPACPLVHARIRLATSAGCPYIYSQLFTTRMTASRSSQEQQKKEAC